MASNSQVGKIVVVAALTLFLYYFFWVSILPFMLIDEGERSDDKDKDFYTITKDPGGPFVFQLM